MKKLLIIFCTLCLSLSLISCASTATHQQKGTGVGIATGAAVGAILGQVIGGDQQSTLWGAGIGAVLGGIAGNQIGSYMDRQEAALRDALANSEAATIERINASSAQTDAKIEEARAEAKEGDIQTAQDVLTATFKSEFLFDTNSSTLKPGAYTEINRVATVLKNYPETLISIEGHTDSKGTEEYNMELSKKRAEAVKAALVQQGVDSARIACSGFGESQPISSDDSMNRRVVIVIQPVVKTVG